MKINEKKQIVEQLSSDLKDSHFYLANSEGLTSGQVTRLRQKCFQAGITYRVVKNTLLLRALKKIKNDELDLKVLQEQVLKGATSVFMVREEVSQPAKLLKKFHQEEKPLKKPTLKAAFVFDTLYLGAQHLETLSVLKSKEELIAEVLQLLQAPMQNTLAALESSGGKIAGVLSTLENKKTTSN